MKYLCMLFVDGTKMGALSPSESQALDDESVSYDEELQKHGHYIIAEALQSGRTAATVRLDKGKVAVTDGPFMETKEQMGGFILIDAKDLNEAIQLASKIPLARFGCVEVRPILDLVAN